jgi:hypothetical protein
LKKALKLMGVIFTECLFHPRETSIINWEEGKFVIKRE